MQMAWQRNSSRQLTIRPPIDFVIPQVSRIGSNYRKCDSWQLDIESTPGSHIQLNRSITINMQEMDILFSSRQRQTHRIPALEQTHRWGKQKLWHQQKEEEYCSYIEQWRSKESAITKWSRRKSVHLAKSSKSQTSSCLTALWWMGIPEASTSPP